MNRPIEELRELVGKGMLQSDAIETMQRLGLTITDAIKLTRELFHINLGAAKTAVASHPAYTRIAEASQPLQDEVFRAFQDIVTTNPDEISR